MRSADKAVIFDIKHYAIHDGPGIRTTVFLKGCPQKCEWCANPESQYVSPEVLYDKNRCTLCHECSNVCLHDAISFMSGRRRYDRKRCQGCGLCVKACSSEAIELCGYTVDVETLWEQIKDDRAFWDRSGGGVTLSGGEPLLQPEFAKQFLAYCQCQYVHTAIETCGHVPEKNIEEVLQYVNLVIFDFKVEDTVTHERITGVPNQQIKKHLLKLLESGRDVLVRMPLIPGCNDSPDNIHKIGEFLEKAKPGTFFEILPYHRLGENKYTRLGREYALSGVKTPDDEQLDSVFVMLSQFDLEVSIGRNNEVNQQTNSV